MGWTAHYQVIREKPLSESEIAELADLVRKQQKLPWDSEPFRIYVATMPRADQVIVDGWNKLSMDEESGDVEMLEEALEHLEGMLGGELRVRDDFGALDTEQHPLDIPYGELSDPLDLVAAKPLAVAANSDLQGLIDAILETEDDKQRSELGKRLAECDPLTVAKTIYAQYARCGRNFELRHVLGRALERLPDPTQVVGEFLDAWCKPDGTYYYNDMPRSDAFAAAMGRVPAVVEQMIADVAAADDNPDNDIANRRAEAALRVLVAGGQLKPVLHAIRSHRGKDMPWRVRSYVFDSPHRMLAEQGEPRAVPTLLHFIYSAKKFGIEGWVMQGLVKHAPDRARALVHDFVKREVHREQCIEWLRMLGGPDELALADKLAKTAEASIYDRAIDVDKNTRHEALRKLAERKDPATFVSLVLAEALDKHLRARTDDACLAFSWWDWQDILPKEAIEGSTAKKLKWFETAGKKLLGDQEMWPQVAEIEKVGAAKVAESYPSETMEADPATLKALEAEETAIFEQL